MLLEFRAGNYKSFRDEFVFSMAPAPKQKGLDYSILEERIGSKAHKALSTAVIYGPNAAGKSNIIGAMDTFRCIVLNGSIRNPQSLISPNPAAWNLSLVPNIKTETEEPVRFTIRFIARGMLFEYGLSIAIGTFLSDHKERKILEEHLRVNEKDIFLRKDKVLFVNESKDTEQYMLAEFKKNKDVLFGVANENLNAEELFLFAGFKAMFSPKLADIMLDWFKEQFWTVLSGDKFTSYPDGMQKRDQEAVYVNDELDAALKELDVSSVRVGYRYFKDETTPRLCSYVQKGKDLIELPASVFESYGSYRLAGLLPMIINAIKQGGILVVDEFDASLHPMVLINLINIFHNDEINVNNAQLIFTTHNPIFLNANMLRRDEIKFVERDEETGDSMLYSLSDFGTAGQDGVRKHEDYLKNYFIGRYGAIQHIDLAPLFESLVTTSRVASPKK